MRKFKPNIFIVEDDNFYNSVISNYLKIKGHKVYSFLSGEECLAYNGIIPDIVYLDFILPGIDGIEVMCQMKPKYPKADFILLSGQTDVKVVLEALHEGAYDYIVKDSNAKENALNKIDHILRFRKIKREKDIYRTSIYIVVTVLILSWLFLFIIYQTK
jgi:DNA-binding NtrC family response regulator